MSVGWLVVTLAGAAGIVMTVLLFLDGSQSQPTLAIPAEPSAESPLEVLDSRIPPVSVIAEESQSPIEADPVSASTSPAPQLAAELDWGLELSHAVPPADPFGEFAASFTLDAPLHEATLTEDRLLALVDLFDRQPWDRFQPSETPAVEPVSYRERTEREQQSASETVAAASEDEEPTTAIVGPAEIKVGIERLAPEMAVMRQAYEYQLVVRNHGDEPLGRVEVTEAVSQLDEVLDVSPAARISDDSLSWQLRDLAPGEDRVLTIQYRAEEPGTVEGTASLTTTAAVTATTLVQGISMNCQASSPRQVQVGDSFHVTIRVTNPSAAPVENVVIAVDVPENVRHHHGRALEKRLGTLQPGETREARLQVRAIHPGPVATRFDITTPHSQAAAEAEFTVIPRTAAPRTASPCFDCVPHCWSYRVQ